MSTTEEQPIVEGVNVESTLAALNLEENNDSANNNNTNNTNNTPKPSGPVLESVSPEAVEIRPSQRCVLEDFTPCSQSHLWKLMMSFYDRKGPSSWSQGIVPHFITCNTFIGKSYAKILHGFIQDCCRPNAQMPLNPNEPLYIIELGAGSGKFTFFMLKALEEMADILEFPFEKIVFVMTDFTENNFNFWRNHSALKKYFDSGRLDAAIFNATEDRSITLWRSGKVLGPGSSVNPICVVANYLFDTLYHDIFQVEDGVLKEGLVSTGSKLAEEPDPLHPDIIQRLDNLYQYNPISTYYYKDEEGDELHFQRILHWYQDHFGPQSSGASFLMPIGALRALRRLCRFSNGRALVLSGDKGNNHPEQFAGINDPHIAVHGSFSLMVNYHAIGAWFTSKGGFALHNPQEEASLKVSCFLLNSGTQDNTSPLRDEMYVGADFEMRDAARSSAYKQMRFAFNEYSTIFGPNDFFVLQKSIKEDMQNPPLRTVVSLLKLADWDPDVFYKFRDVILNQAPLCNIKLKNDLCRGIPKVWENYFIMDMDKDIAFEIGRFYYGIREYANALKYYSISKETVGDHHVTSHNQGLCHYSLGSLEIAREHFKYSLGLNGDYEKARSWIEKVSKELAAKEGNNQSSESQVDDVTSLPVPPPTGDEAPVPPTSVLA